MNPSEPVSAERDTERLSQGGPLRIVRSPDWAPRRAARVSQQCDGVDASEEASQVRCDVR